MLKTLFVWTVVIALTATATWYFFLKEYDYSIIFKTKGTPGEIYQQLLYYQYNDLNDVSYLQKTPFDELTQSVKLENTDFRLTWKFEELNDSLSLITANVNRMDNKFFSRLALLFGQDEHKEILKEEVKGFQLALKQEAELFDITIEGITTSPSTTCACIGLENEVRNKALDMMQNIEHLSAYIRNNNLEMEARPRVNVLSWNTKSDFIKYEFCFPIDPGKLPAETNRIYLKEFPEMESLMAIYNGNYMYSHLAWAKMLDYAEENKFEVLNQPLEVFNDNPEMGGDARQWEAEIYLPLK